MGAQLIELEDGPVETPPTLEEALEEAELQAVKTSTFSLEQVLEIAAADCRHPHCTAVWRDTVEISGQADILFPAHKVAVLAIEDSVEPQAAGHALVLAANGGYINCVRGLRELMSKKHAGSILVGRFSAYAFLKACENGHQEVIRELLRPTASAGIAMMGYVIATRWKDKDPSAYPFVKMPANIPGKEWLAKLASTRQMLPAAAPISRAEGWDLRGMPGVPEELHDCIRAGYSIFLLWRAGLIAAANCHVEVFKVLLRQRALENTMLADSFHDTSGLRKGFDHDGKKIISERAKMDTLMYQLVEELSTKNYHDGILYVLWGHIQRGGRDSPRPEAGRPRCVAQATNGVWEMQLEVPLLMMPVEHALQEEEPFRRYKQLTQLFSQRAKVNIQLTASVEALTNCLQIVVGIKHVRYKVENSRWDSECMGHFPSLVTLSVTPVTDEGTGVTMTNSSSNIVMKVGQMERIQIGTHGNDGMSTGVSGGIAASAAIGMSTTMKNKPWRFEQLPLQDERGGSFVWTLQSMKGLLFDRSNPMRMADRNSRWRFGRRIPGNPLDELPFTSEGGVIFTSGEFDDTMIWRFPKHMENKKMRWSIEGQIHSTYTTARYFETRMATFCGDIEEPLKPLEVKDKKGGKGGADEKPDKGEKGDKKEKGEEGEKGDKEKKDKGEKGEKGDKEKKEKGDKGDKEEKKEKKEKKEKLAAADGTDSGTAIGTPDPSLYRDAEYQEFLQFKMFKERLRRQSLSGSLDHLNYEALDSLQADEETEKVGFVVPEKDILGNQIAIEIPQRVSSLGRTAATIPEPESEPSTDRNDDAEYVLIGSADDLDDLEGLRCGSAAEDVLAPKIAAEEIMRRSEDSEAVSRSDWLSSENRRPVSVRTRSGKSTDIGR